jgi:hypothetical protein
MSSRFGSLPSPLQGICDHGICYVKTGSSKILNDRSRFRNSTEPLREDDQADRSKKREQVNPSDLVQEDERRRVDDALDRHVPPRQSVLRKSPGRREPRHVRVPR